MIVDAHQHFWRLDRGDYAFPAPGDAVLYRDFLPPDLAPQLAAAGVDQTIAVQATDTLAETEFLLALACETRTVAGVVGWWDPRQSDCLARLMAMPYADRLVGVRPMLQKYDDIGFLLTPQADAEVQKMAELGLTFDALVDCRHLRTLHAFARRHSGLSIMINHFAKPWRHPDRLDEFWGAMELLAGNPHCCLKLSGYPFGVAGSAGFADLLSRALTLFGEDRLVWGSDWPVAKREGDYGQILETVRSNIDVASRRRIFGENARRLYRLTGLPRDRGASHQLG